MDEVKNISEAFIRGGVLGIAVNGAQLKKNEYINSPFLVRVLNVTNTLAKIPVIGTAVAAVKFGLGALALLISSIALGIFSVSDKKEDAMLTAAIAGMAIFSMTINLGEAIPVFGTFHHMIIDDLANSILKEYSD